jgi:hypothetical protein
MCSSQTTQISNGRAKDSNTSTIFDRHCHGERRIYMPGAARLFHNEIFTAVPIDCQGDHTALGPMEGAIFVVYSECGIVGRWHSSYHYNFLVQIPPSWMASWGSPTQKPSRIWGTASAAKIQPRPSFLLELCGSHHHCRLWIPQLYCKLSKLHRLKLAANAKALKVTIKKRKADGSLSVS